MDVCQDSRGNRGIARLDAREWIKFKTADQFKTSDWGFCQRFQSCILWKSANTNLCYIYESTIDQNTAFDYAFTASPLASQAPGTPSAGRSSDPVQPNRWVPNWRVNGLKRTSISSTPQLIRTSRGSAPASAVLRCSISDSTPPRLVAGCVHHERLRVHSSGNT